ncbi:MAG: hypothetical protein JWO80_6313 [Bryobacterales bacterium]|nr:hypothetical protein [Bryobacterales bacterium]
MHVYVGSRYSTDAKIENKCFRDYQAQPPHAQCGAMNGRRLTVINRLLAVMKLNANSGRRWLFAISFAVSAVLLYLALRGVEWSRVGQIVASARWPVLLMSVVLAPIQPLLRATRWRVLLNAEGRIALGTVFWANSAGYFGNSFLPGRAGELVRTMMISRRSNLATPYVLTTALAERAFDLLFLIIASSIALAAIPGKPAWLTSASHTMAAAGIVAAIGLAFIPKTERLMTWVLTKLPVSARLREKLLGIAAQVRLGVNALHQPARLARFLGLTIVIWTGDVLIVMLTAYILHLYLSFPQGLLLVTALGLSSAIPSTPGYVGVYQFVAVTVLTPFGFTRNDALAYILMVQVLGYLVTTVLGLLALWKFNLSFSSLKSAEAAPAPRPEVGVA